MAMATPEMAPEAQPEGQRFKLRFPQTEAVAAAMALEAPGAGRKLLSNTRRRFVALEFPPDLDSGQILERSEIYQREFGAMLVPDFQYDLEPNEIDFEFFTESIETDASLDDVVDAVRAPQAWEKTRGADVTIAVVDTGVSGARPEFPNSKRKGSWQIEGDTPWTDWEGHGSMCACIAAATRDSGGSFDGIAPDAGLIACKTRFYDSELANIYDYLADLKAEGVKIVASNSFGMKRGTPPDPDPDSDFLPALDRAISEGIPVIFSAGNNHQRAGGHPDECEPNSVWLYKSRADLMAVATCDLQNRMWFYSSRGPGQFFGQPNTNRKPDVTAPTPRNGRVVYGDDVRSLANGWGTSGACPQVAGLAALLLSAQPALTADDIFNIIRDTAVDIGHGEHCQGHGRIDCERAVLQAVS